MTGIAAQLSTGRPRYSSPRYPLWALLESMKRKGIASGFVVLSLMLSGWVDPASGQRSPSRVTRGFEQPEKEWSPGHRGVDVPLEPGAPVLAAGAGRVAFVGVVAGTPVVSVDHPEGFRTTYQPVHAAVSRGDVVAEGEVIGRLGHGHPGLHWGAKTGPDTYFDPLELLDAPVIRLKPL